MNESNDKVNGGVGVLGLLGIAFIVLKLTKVIDWSWWFVTMPFWISAILAIILIIILILLKKKAR